MKFQFVTATLTAALIAGSASAQTVSFGSSAQGTSNNALSSALGKVVSEKQGLKVRVVPMGSLEQYGPMINSGRMEFAITGGTDVQLAYDGKVTFKGRALKNPSSYCLTLFISNCDDRSKGLTG